MFGRPLLKSLSIAIPAGWLIGLFAYGVVTSRDNTAFSWSQLMSSTFGLGTVLGMLLVWGYWLHRLGIYLIVRYCIGKQE